MATEIFTGTAVKVTDVEKLSPGEKLGILPGDVLLKIGKREPLEASCCNHWRRNRHHA